MAAEKCKKQRCNLFKLAGRMTQKKQTQALAELQESLGARTHPQIEIECYDIFKTRQGHSKLLVQWWFFERGVPNKKNIIVLLTSRHSPLEKPDDFRVNG